MHISVKWIMLLVWTVCICAGCSAYDLSVPGANTNTTDEQKSYIKWVDFNATYDALRDALDADIASYGSERHHSWIDLLAYITAKNGNNFAGYTKAQMTNLVKKLDTDSMESLTKDLKYYRHYKQIYSAVLGEYVGEYAVQSYSGGDDAVTWQRKYGLKAFCPIAKGYSFEHYNDFAATRTYGYTRRHTGHDLMGNTGTPVVAIESGTVECAGWNRYGGWRIGIRSFDKKRYYYYAHLRKDHPYTHIIKEGATVKAGDVIGYMGMTGYSTKENVNNINVPHLHMGIQLIFDESQKDGTGDIWIDAYNIVKLLMQNRSEAYRDDKSGEYIRRYNFYEKSLGGVGSVCD